MKCGVFSILLSLMLCLTLSAGAEKPGDNVTITFVIPENPHQAISARVGMEFDSRAFEFVSAETLSPDVLNSPPTSETGKFGLINMGGISPGEIGTITLRIKPDAPVGRYKINPVVDSVYNVKRETVELTVKGGEVSVDHVWDDGRITVEPTCYSEGVMTYYCFYCSEKRMEVVPVTEHREGVAIVTKIATCTSDGVQVYPCDICHDTLREESIPAFGHADGEIVVTQEPTCTVDGVRSVQCANCGKTVCTEGIPATGHVWDSGIITKEPTTAEEGVKTFTCTVCKTIRTEVIPKLEVVRIPGDANEDGRVDIMDALLTLQYSVGWDVAINTSNADVDDSGAVNIMDALLILQYSVGWDVKLQ